MKLFFIAICSLFIIQSHAAPSPVLAKYETDAVNASGDAADDPAIWVHATDSTKSLIFGANKRGAVHAYTLQGKEVARYDVGNINNIDVRYELMNSKNEMVDLLGGSDRTRSTLLFMSVNRSTGALKKLNVKNQINIKDPYGFCFYKSKKNNKLHAISVSKKGKIEQFELETLTPDEITFKKVRDLSVKSQAEGCVADDTTGALFVGEESTGVWTWGAEAADSTKAVLVDAVGKGHLKADVEGVSLYYKKSGPAYLVVSSQGDNTFAVYESFAPYKFVGHFKIVDGPHADGVNDTDGIETTHVALNAEFPEGMMVIQDGSNAGKNGEENQNFKIVDWRDIKRMLNLEN